MRRHPWLAENAPAVAISASRILVPPTARVGPSLIVMGYSPKASKLQ
jgi:hypothetical protein